MSKSQKLRDLKEAKLKRLKWEAYRCDPLFWLKDRFGEDTKSFVWSEYEGYDKHNWDGDIDPLANAWRTIGESYREVRNGDLPTYRYVGIESATGTSKTYWLARLAIWFLDCFENSLVVTTAPKQDQLKLGLWSEISSVQHRVKRIRPEAELYKLRLAIDDKNNEVTLDEANMSDSWHAVGFVAGTGSDEQSAEKARGFHRKHMLIILEECTGINLPIITAFQNTSTGLTNFIVAVGNPSNEFDPLHQFCTQPDVKSFRISAFDYPNVVMNKEIIGGAVTWSSINSRTTTYGDGSPIWNAMIRGLSPTQATDSLIRLDWIEQCVDLDIPEENQLGYNAAGTDVANSATGDKAAIAWGTGPILRKLQEFHCENATHLAYNMVMSSAELLNNGYKDYGTDTIYDYGVEADCIGVDAVGVGVATVNAFVDMGMDIQGLQGGYWEEAIPLDDKGKVIFKFASLRAQMFWELREDFRKKNISISTVDIPPQLLNQLKKELCIPKFEANNNYIAVEQKESIKKRLGGKSPNVADAVAYWNWVRKGYRIKRFTFAAISAGE